MDYVSEIPKKQGDRIHLKTIISYNSRIKMARNNKDIESLRRIKNDILNKYKIGQNFTKNFEEIAETIDKYIKEIEYCNVFSTIKTDNSPEKWKFLMRKYNINDSDNEILKAILSASSIRVKKALNQKKYDALAKYILNLRNIFLKNSKTHSDDFNNLIVNEIDIVLNNTSSNKDKKDITYKLKKLEIINEDIEKIQHNKKLDDIDKAVSALKLSLFREKNRIMHKHIKDKKTCKELIPTRDVVGLSLGICVSIYSTSSSRNDYGGYDTKYSECGQMIHDVKYKNLQDSEKISIIKNKLMPIIIQNTNNLPIWRDDLIVVPMPFNNKRSLQHVYEIAKRLAEQKNKPYSDSILHKNSKIQAKNAENGFEDGDFTSTYYGQKTSILIVDDIYGQGNSLKACIKTLKQNSNIRSIYYLGVTKIRRKGLKNDYDNLY